VPKQPKLSKQKSMGYEYWGATIKGKRLRFGRVGEVDFSVAQEAFWKALVEYSPVAERPETGALTVEQLCLAHCEWHKLHNEKRTTDNRILFLDRWCSHIHNGQYVGGMQAVDVTKEHLATFLAGVGDGWTLWNYCVAVKAAFNWGLREHHISNNPLSSFRNPPQPQSDVSEASLITKDEVAWFLEKSKPYGAHEILRVLYLTGARPGELCSAIGSDYVSSTKQLRLLQWKNGKKTKLARRIVLSSEAASIVSGSAKKKTDSIFRGPNGAAWTPNRLQKIWRKIRDGEWRTIVDGKFEKLTAKENSERIKATKQREDLSLYSLRHLWISDALQQGIPIATIAKLAGTSIKMIERTYGHFRNDDLGDVVNRIAENR